MIELFAEQHVLKPKMSLYTQLFFLLKGCFSHVALHCGISESGNVTNNLFFRSLSFFVHFYSVQNNLCIQPNNAHIV